MEKIRQIISQNNLSSVADAHSLLKESFKDILQELLETGTVLQNNYNTDYSENVDSSRSMRTAGAVNVTWDASMTMNGGMIQDCYTLWVGGIQSSKTAEVTLTSDTIRRCAAVRGRALGLMGPSEAAEWY